MARIKSVMITRSGSGVDLDEFQVALIECLQRRETRVKVKVICRSNPGLTRIMGKVHMHGVDDEGEREYRTRSKSLDFSLLCFQFPREIYVCVFGNKQNFTKN